MLTMYDGDEDIHRALEAGATTYLLKGSPSDDLDPHRSRRPCRRPANSTGCAPEARGSRVATVTDAARGARARARLAGTTQQGNRDDIVDQRRHGQVHLKNIFTKLDVHDRTAAVYVALRRGIIHVR